MIIFRILKMRKKQTPAVQANLSLKRNNEEWKENLTAYSRYKLQLQKYPQILRNERNSQIQGTAVFKSEQSRWGMTSAALFSGAQVHRLIQKASFCGCREAFCCTFASASTTTIQRMIHDIRRSLLQGVGTLRRGRVGEGPR